MVKEVGMGEREPVSGGREGGCVKTPAGWRRTEKDLPVLHSRGGIRRGNQVKIIILLSVCITHAQVLL